MSIIASVHRWVRHEHVPAYTELGWVELPTLNGTHHGAWSTHMAWPDELGEPREPEAQEKEGQAQ